MRKRVFSLILSAMLTIGFTKVYATESVTALYGGDMNGGDAYEFAITMRKENNCVINEIDEDATVKQFKDAGENSTFIYWSGHGLTTGKMSCYGINSGGNGKSDYINYDDSNAPIMHDEIGSDIHYDQYGHFFLGNTAWSGKVKYVVLAACNQIGSNSSLTAEWKRTMYGSNRVNMIFGYYGTAPANWISHENNYRDNLIAIDFAKMMKNNTIKRSWHLANNAWGIDYSSLLYNSKSASDTISNMTDITLGNDPHPTIILEKAEDVRTSSSVSFISAKEMLNSQIDESFNISEIEEISTDDVEKYSSFTFNKNNINESIGILTEFLRDKDDLPKDAEFFGVKEIKKTVLNADEKEGTVSDEKIESDYIIKYGQTLNKAKVSNLKDGSYMNIYIENNKIAMIDMNWLKVSKNKTPNYMIKNESYSNVTKLEKKIIDIQNASIAINGFKPKLLGRELVYARNEKNELIPKWQLRFDGFTITVD